ncbi:MAG: class I SAM-dependent methyltransferase [Mucispirillum sp.]|nr:class I SAM-dependent methyltransferase [Mucispirillum sp.]
MEKNNAWEKFYEDGGEYTMMQYPFGVVIEFIRTYLSKYNVVGGGYNPKNIKVIELGCGSGANIRYAAKLGLDVYGTDISTTAIEYAKSKFKEEGFDIPDDNLKVCSFDEINFADNYFDMVIDRGALIYADKDMYVRTIDKIYKMLKKGGMLLLTPRSEIDTPTIKLVNDEYGFDSRQNMYKEKFHVENTLSLKDIVKILNNRFEFLKLRRSDRIDYIISKEGNGISSHEVTSMYEIFLEKK